MSNLRKILNISLCFILLLTLNNLQVSAHTQSQSQYYWGDNVGWSIDEHCHNGNTSVTYKFNNSVSAQDKATARAGVSKWSSYASITESSSSVNIISCGSLDNNILACYVPISGNSQGHITKWEISFTSIYTLTSTTIAHEFGHVFGLNDLKASNSINKLMYYTNARTALNLTTSDIKGFNVITGVHTNHTWGQPYSVSGMPANKQQCNCTGCNIIKHLY